MKKIRELKITEDTFYDIIYIKNKVFSPLKGFMTFKEFKSVVEHMTLNDNCIWTIPITLGINEKIKEDEIILVFKNKKIAKIFVEDVYKIKIDDIEKIFKTSDLNHPGVKKEIEKGEYRIGGLIQIIENSILKDQINPNEIKEFFLKKGWKTIAGFQTRNVPHRAHEYLHRLALEICDALFINPLVGWKKKGDFSEEAVNIGYKTLIEIYYKNLNVYYKTLKIPMRYAGPREAIFHAQIRKNLGCTHFIIGRDHAGVKNYYGKYEAHELAKKLQKYLDIELLLFKGPFYCSKCEQIVTENCCKHKNVIEISGTIIRDMIKKGYCPPKNFMRKEVAENILKLKEKIFIK